MATTAQDIINRSREVLNDADKTRWADLALLPYLNAGIQNLAARRPDLFIADNFVPPKLDNLTDEVTAPTMHHQELADYVAARALFTDDDTANSKAAPLLELARNAA